MLYCRLYTKQTLKVENQSITVVHINWETHPLNDGYVVLDILTVNEKDGSQSTETVTMPLKEDPIILDCYATLRATKITGNLDALQVQLALHSEVKLNIEFP